MDNIRHWLKVTFTDKKGRVVIAQSPNIPLLGWFVLELVSLLLHKGHAKSGLQDIATASLFTWAYLEISKGVNYFRRLLGFVVIVLIVGSYFVG
jgi:hypothetical protein